MERCPNCRARDPGTDRCRRCGMELGPLVTAQAVARILVQRGVQELVAGNAEAAIANLERARHLRHDRFAELLLGFVRRQPAQATAGSQGPPVLRWERLLPRPLPDYGE